MGNVKHNTLTANDLHLSKVAVGTGAPVSVPPWTGAIYFDTSGPLVYYSKGTSSVSDWVSITSNSAIDAIFFIINSLDNSKRFRFDASGILSGSSRILSVQDADYILAAKNIAQTFSGIQTFSNTIIAQATAEFLAQGGKGIALNNMLNSFAVRHVSKSSLASNAQYYWPELPNENGRFLSSDTSGNLSWLTDRPSMVANDSDIVFTISDNKSQLGCLPTVPRNYTLPSTGVILGDIYEFNNLSVDDGKYITLKASDASVIDIILPTQYIKLVSKKTTPLTFSDWLVLEADSNYVSWTPSLSGFGANNISVYYKRVRQGISIVGNFGNIFSVSSTDPARFSLPIFSGTFAYAGFAPYCGHGVSADSKPASVIGNGSPCQLYPIGNLGVTSPAISSLSNGSIFTILDMFARVNNFN